MSWNGQQKLANINEKKNFLDVFGVRITPPFLEFRQAFEGKTYKQKLTIQNIGKTKVVIRITTPTSFAYHIKPLRGHNLSPGLTVVREISFVFSIVNSPSTILPIYINGNRYDYEIFATISSAEVVVSPQYIDFGAIDTGFASPVRTIVLTNDGNKPTRFYIDTASHSDYTLVVEPIKGMLPAKASSTITLRLLTHKEGEIFIELWVKAGKPYIVIIKAESINARFEPVNSPLSSTFTLVDFPVTYEGLTSSQTFYIRNSSASAAMFCIFGEVNEEILTLNACEKLQTDYNFFKILPNFGTYQPKQVKPVRFKFQPKKRKPDQKYSFYFCTIHMCRVRSKFLTQEDYDELLNSETAISNNCSRSDWSNSFVTQQYSELDYSTLFSSNSMETYENMRQEQECNCVKFHLHGIPETPQVTATPDELNLADMEVGRREVRVLELKNCSFYLPILVVYKKVAYIDLDKSDIYINAYSGMQVSVYITPKRIGEVNSQIQFDLLWHDQPKTHGEYKVIGKLTVPIRFTTRTVTKVPLPQINTGLSPNYMKEAGKFCQDLKFDGKVPKPRAAIVAGHLISKSSSALIALPNDTQKSLRPWRNKSKCKTIFTKSCRYVPPIDTDYELTVFDRQVKIKTSNYYTNYIRQEAKRLKVAAAPKKAVSEYEIGKNNKYLLTDFKIPLLKSVTSGEIKSPTEYLPLLIHPLQIINVVVDPMVVHAGPMAARHNYEFKLNIRNKNRGTISVLVKPDKSNILFPAGHRKMIKGNSGIDLPIIYLSPSVGIHSVELKLILNDVAYIIVDVIAHVCPVNLKLNTNLIVFSEETTCHYVEISNPLRTDISFRWKVPHDNFEIEPKRGICQASSTLLCYVRFFPNRDGPPIIDADFTSAEQNIDQLRLVTKVANKKLQFVKGTLVFKDIPLNIPVKRTVFLRNDSAVLQYYALIPSALDKFVRVFPSEGEVYPNSCVVIIITLKLTACAAFKNSLTFRITGPDVIELTLTGNVVYPNIVVQPDVLNFKKIPCSSFDVARFTIENTSNTTAYVTFNLSIYPEYLVSKTGDPADISKMGKITLEKYSAMNLYLHFKPFAPCSDRFFLPMIINDILGPVIHENETKSVVRFLSDQIPGSASIVLPSTLDLMSVHSYATEAKIIFSKLFIDLEYAPSPIPCKCTYQLKISNPQSETEKVCIRTDELEHPLNLTLIEGAGVSQVDKAIVFTLEPQQEVQFEVSFYPDQVGSYKAVLPIFLRSDKSKRPHNFLCIGGLFPIPTIISTPPTLYSKPLPLRVKVFRKGRFILKHHFPNCVIKVDCPMPDIELKIFKKTPLGDDTEEMLITGYLVAQICVNANLVFSLSCTCGAQCEVPLYVTAENCFLTNYALVHTFILNPEYNLELKKLPSIDVTNRPSLLSIMDAPKMLIEEYDLSQFYLCYPLFPDEKDDLHKFMNSCISVMENWVYTQGFFDVTYYKIPEGISYLEFSKDPKYGSKFAETPPYIQLLINILGEQMEKYFELDKPLKYPTPEEEAAYLTLNLYKKVMDFLISEGAYFTGLSPLHLMPYETYMWFIRNQPKQVDMNSTLMITEYSEFYRLGKQAWLDILLQTYKVFILFRLLKPFDKIHPTLQTDPNPHQKYRNSIKNITTNSHLFSTTELLLLNWLKLHYKDVKETYWADNYYLQEKEVSYFGDNMDDGFIYAAVTLAYCPYFADHFKELCPYPGSVEELLHNNIKVIQTWDILNLNSGVTVDNLLYPHPLRTLLTIAYLFEVLPHMYPVETIEFKAGLSEQTSKILTISNSNNFAVAYKAVLYGNESGSFEIRRSLYVIQPKGKCKIVINYWAKFIKVSSCTLILSGECKGYRYARSKVVTLKGEPDVSYMTANYESVSELYKVYSKKLNIIAPYAVATSYKLQYTTSNCVTAEDVEKTPYRNDLPTFRVPRCMPLETMFESNKDGEGELTIYVLTLTMRTISTFVFFRNAEVGDFAVEIKTKVKPSQKQELLKVELPSHFGEAGYRWTRTSGIFLEIPCQNRTTWKAIVEMESKLAKSDFDFWKDLIYTTAGVHALQRLINFSSHPWAATIRMCEPSDYKIIADKNCPIVLPDLIHIHDKCSMDFVKIPLRFLSKKYPQSFSIVLKSTDGMEVRQYRVYFERASATDLPPLP